MAFFVVDCKGCSPEYIQAESEDEAAEMFKEWFPGREEFGIAECCRLSGIGGEAQFIPFDPRGSGDPILFKHTVGDVTRLHRGIMAHDA